MSQNGYDIFVSYAHVDDDPQPGIEKGWVSTFVDSLRKYLAQELGRPDAYSLWMDYELRGNEPLTAAIDRELSAAKTMVLFLSKPYVASDWCREELATFANQWEPEDARIFPIYVSPVDEIPEPLQDLPKYQFWIDDPTGPRTLADPQPIPTEREYYQEIRKLARELAAKLKGISRPPPGPGGPGGLTVFVNGGEQDIDLMRRTATRLKDMGCGYVLPLSASGNGNGASPTSAEEITRDLHDNLENCDEVLVVYRDSDRTQVRQLIKEYRKHKARSEDVPERIHLCRADAKAAELDMDFPELEIYCTDEACVDACVERFLGEVWP